MGVAARGGGRHLARRRDAALWGAAPRSAGGLGLTTNEIGMMLGLIGVVLLVMFALFAPVDKLLGTLDAFRCPRPLASVSS